MIWYAEHDESSGSTTRQLAHPLIPIVAAQSSINFRISFALNMLSYLLRNLGRLGDGVELLGNCTPLPFRYQALPLKHGEHLIGNLQKENGELEH